MRKVKIGDTIRIIRMDDQGGKDLQAREYNGQTRHCGAYRLHRSAARHLGRTRYHSGSG